MKTIFKIMLGIVLGGVLLAVGCAALVGTGVDQAVKEAEREQNARGITMKQFRAVKQGTSQRRIERRLGAPEDAQEFENQIPELQDQPSRSSCIYYPEADKPLFEGRSFQFCFDEGRLTSKNAY